MTEGNPDGTELGLDDGIEDGIAVVFVDGLFDERILGAVEAESIGLVEGISDREPVGKIVGITLGFSVDEEVLGSLKGEILGLVEGIPGRDSDVDVLGEADGGTVVLSVTWNDGALDFLIICILSLNVSLSTGLPSTVI